MVAGWIESVLPWTSLSCLSYEQLRFRYIMYNFNVHVYRS
ncbi:hypothetical protein V6Z12_A05G183500 [Gossypium hirsutum]